MAKLVFKGHATRGKELHKLLENLGGVDSGYEKCNCVTCFYYINREGFIEGSNMIPNYMTHRMIMSLETFESQYPYKVGDKVVGVNGLHGTITTMCWDECNCTVRYTFKEDEVGTHRHGYTATMLKPYKKEISGAIIDRFICLEGFEFYDDKGNIINTKEITMKKKKPQYPKTFIECAKILDCFCSAYIDGYKWELLENLQELLICRNAYWKIAGNWKPDYTNPDIDLYVIINVHNNIEKAKYGYGFQNCVLSFPTEEMRDAFYENFKALIEECKELL